MKKWNEMRFNLRPNLTVLFLSTVNQKKGAKSPRTERRWQGTRSKEYLRCFERRTAQPAVVRAIEMVPYFWGAVLSLLLGGDCNCPENTSNFAVSSRSPKQASKTRLKDDKSEDDRPTSLAPTPREPGPPKIELESQIIKTRSEVTQWLAALEQNNFPAREIASMADIRGYRLYRKRFFKQAHIWFEAAAKVDPSYELALFNAARTAVLLGDVLAARKHLFRLKKLDTPLSRSRLKLIDSDPDFAKLRSEEALVGKP